LLENSTIVIGGIGIILLLVLALWLSIRVVNRGDKLVVYRLGNTDDTLVKGPGLVLLIPFIDRPHRVNLREQYVEVPSQTAITKDNVTIPIDFLIYWRIVDPLKSVVNVQDFVGALAGVATTNLRAVVGDFLLDDVLSKRDLINESLRTKLDEITENWGGKVTRVEIREITPPRDILDSMNRMLSAERNRRAVITESEGARQSAINVAEGQKQSEILKAEGERQAAILRAEGFSEALTRIFQAATGVDQKTMSLQYLETLKALGNGPATKFVIPIEFTRLLEPITEFLQPVDADGRRGPGGGGGALGAGMQTGGPERTAPVQRPPIEPNDPTAR
jgi:regulator of protease activity HflC (stomatin/prohibitin superfamily)